MRTGTRDRFRVVTGGHRASQARVTTATRPTVGGSQPYATDR
ncbi:hypothetical protein [Streptomyces buecherae]|nr:hypothetical protein [Streptomyces buecherae]